MAKYLDDHGLETLWDKSKDTFVNGFCVNLVDDAESESIVVDPTQYTTHSDAVTAIDTAIANKKLVYCKYVGSTSTNYFFFEKKEGNNRSFISITAAQISTVNIDNSSVILTTVNTASAGVEYVTSNNTFAEVDAIYLAGKLPIYRFAIPNTAVYFYLPMTGHPYAGTGSYQFSGACAVDGKQLFYITLGSSGWGTLSQKTIVTEDDEIGASYISPKSPLMIANNLNAYVLLATVTFVTNDAMYAGINATAFWRIGSHSTGSGRLAIFPCEYQVDDWYGVVAVDMMRLIDPVYESELSQVKFGFVIDRDNKKLEIWGYKEGYKYLWCNISAPAGSTVTYPGGNATWETTAPSGFKELPFRLLDVDRYGNRYSRFISIPSDKYLRIKINNVNATLDLVFTLFSSYRYCPFGIQVAGRYSNGTFDSGGVGISLLGNGIYSDLSGASSTTFLPAATWGTDSSGNAYIFLKWYNYIRAVCFYGMQEPSPNRIELSLVSDTSAASSTTNCVKMWGNAHVPTAGTNVGNADRPVYVDSDGTIKPCTYSIIPSATGTDTNTIYLV